MSEPCRIRFSKTGRAKFISHLDLQHTIQRAFIRAGIPMKHTEGFNPHPYMTIPMPLSVGMESICEIMDFELETALPFESICPAINSVLPEGIRFIEAYHPESNLKEIGKLLISGVWEYDGKALPNAELFNILFSTAPLIVEKRTKRGLSETDISESIFNICFSGQDAIRIQALLSAREPTVNPNLFVKAVERYLPNFVPNAAFYKREALYFDNGAVFR